MAGEVEEPTTEIGDRATAWKAVTAISPFRVPGWGAFLRGQFWVAPRLLPFLVTPLVKLAFIHVGTWSIVTRLPSPDEPGRWIRLKPGFLIFATNYDGAWRPYIEAFARVMPVQWLGIWGGTRNFPGPLPASKLLAHIDSVDQRPAYYYSAHTHESLRSINAALDVDRALDAFVAADHGPDAFDDAFDALLGEVQWRL